MQLPIPTLRPGFLRGLISMVTLGLAFAVTYRSIAMGGIWLVSAVLLMGMGFLLGNFRGLFMGMVSVIPAYVLLFFPIPPASAEFGTLLVAFVVYLAIVPTVFVALGFALKKASGALIAGLLVVPLYLNFLIPFPLAMGAGPVNGTALVFAALGAALGYVWGVGGFGAGASAHEGPTYYAAVADLEKPRVQPVRALVAFVREQTPTVRNLIVPLIRPTLVSLGIAVGIIAAVMFVATNPIVPVARTQTDNTAASTLIVTGDKFVLFVVVALVILGAVVGLAFLVALGVNAINHQVNRAKKEQPQPLPLERLRVARVFDFFVTWVNDVFASIRRTVRR